MEVLKECKYTKEGNDCLIKDYVCLIKLDYHLYAVVHTNEVCGGWTGNPIITKSEAFKDYDDALDYMTKLIREI